MEVFVAMAAVVAGSVFYLWRRNRRTGYTIEDQTKGLPDDLRDKQYGQASQPNRGRPWGRGN